MQTTEMMVLNQKLSRVVKILQFHLFRFLHRWPFQQFSNPHPFKSPALIPTHSYTCRRKTVQNSSQNTTKVATRESNLCRSIEIPQYTSTETKNRLHQSGSTTHRCQCPTIQRKLFQQTKSKSLQCSSRP